MSALPWGHAVGTLRFRHNNTLNEGQGLSRTCARMPATPSMAQRACTRSDSANHARRSGLAPRPRGSKPKLPGSLLFSRCAGKSLPGSQMGRAAAWTATVERAARAGVALATCERAWAGRRGEACWGYAGRICARWERSDRGERAHARLHARQATAEGWVLATAPRAAGGLPGAERAPIHRIRLLWLLKRTPGGCESPAGPHSPPGCLQQRSSRTAPACLCDAD